MSGSWIRVPALPAKDLQPGTHIVSGASVSRVRTVQRCLPSLFPPWNVQLAVIALVLSL